MRVYAFSLLWKCECKCVFSLLWKCLCVCVFNLMWKCVCLPDVEVLDIDVLVGCRLPLAPQQKTLLRRGLCRQRGMEERKEGERGRKKQKRKDGEREKEEISGKDRGGSETEGQKEQKMKKHYSMFFHYCRKT